MVEEIILQRRSIRKYTDEKVDKGELEEILMHSLMGPSNANARPVQFVVVEDKESLKKLAGVEKFGTTYIKDVPMVVLVIADTEASTTWVEEGAIAASYLQLLAEEKGYSTCWINVREGKTPEGVEMQDYIREEFSIPKKYGVLCMIPIGRKNEKVRKREKFEIGEKVHYEKF